MIAGGDIKGVQKGEVGCGNVVHKPQREACESLVMDKFKEVCSQAADNDKVPCENDVTDIFTSQYNYCANIYQNKIFKTADQRLAATADCFHNNVKGVAKGPKSNKFDASQVKQRIFKEHLAIVRKIYSPKPAAQTKGITLADARSKFCPDGVLHAREECGQQIEQKYNETCRQAEKAKECLQELIAVFQAQHDKVDKTNIGKPAGERDQAFSNDIQNPVLKFGVGDVMDLTLQEHGAILKRRFK